MTDTTTKIGSARANANLALAKYWGKRDEELHLPVHSSISVTLDGLETHSTVAFSPELTTDYLTLNGKPVDSESEQFRAFIGRFLETVRKRAGIDLHAKVVSENNFPTGAGLASSASAFAALALAANEALGLQLGVEELSILARYGSGSATRSLLGGFNEWSAGERPDGSDSHIVSIADGLHWPELRVLVCITTTEGKKVSSRAGMQQTVNTSDVYKDSWLPRVEQDLCAIRSAILEKDLELLGETAERNALRMHASMLATRPPVLYLNQTALSIINAVHLLRKDGLTAYCTMDAGPQVKVLCLEHESPALQARLKALPALQEVRECRVAPQDPMAVSDHLYQEC